ncbi:hypothetical protein RF55_11479 [Lasius niger]|uniref:Uncharacterized protein n=1 Tax=Lasius niger TaxID=67767 RepID=A0A0J7N8I6_LASNI|nr:hypothetical protein RF55_11479 [Lasius niger]
MVLDPSTFKDSFTSISDIKIKWFINLISSHIPQEVQCLLQLGDNFNLPTIDKEKTIVEFIKSIEHNTDKLPANIRLAVRNRSFNIINDFSKSNIRISSHDKFLTKASITRKFMLYNPNVVFTRAYKGNITVALNRDNYIEKMTHMLSDTNTYVPVKKDPTKSLISNLRKLLTG